MGYLQRLIAFRNHMKWSLNEGRKLSKPDLIFASSTPLTVGEVGRLLALHHKVPFVFEVRDVWPEIPHAMGMLKNPLLRWSAYRMAGRVYSASDHIVALSPDMKTMIEKWGVLPDRISVVPNCSDNTIFGSSEGREEVRKRYGWENKFVCVHPGAMGAVNGLDYMIDCAKHMDSLGFDDILLAIIGEGNQKSRLEKRIADEGIRSAVIYDPVPKRDMPGLLAASDAGMVCVTPCPVLAANSANKFFDFLAAGLPVIINYGGWQAEYLKQYKCGYSLDPHMPSALADALTQLRDDETLRTTMAAEARALACEEFDRDKLVDQLESILLAQVESKSQTVMV
jgi:glycosyltransferase involved in cell wall biosynthesis